MKKMKTSTLENDYKLLLRQHSHFNKVRMSVKYKKKKNKNFNILKTIFLSINVLKSIFFYILYPH